MLKKTFFVILFLIFSGGLILISKDQQEQVQQDVGKMLLGDRSLSQNLKPEELMVLETVIPEDVRRSVAEGFGTCYLKYFDAQIALAGCAEGKPGNPISAYKISRSNKDASLIGLGGELNALVGYYESENIMFSVSDSVITYFRPGFTEIKKVPGSELDYQVENYVKQGGMQNNYEFSFDQNTNILTVSVFRNEHTEAPNTKLREVQFVLE